MLRLAPALVERLTKEPPFSACGPCDPQRWAGEPFLGQPGVLGRELGTCGPGSVCVEDLGSAFVTQ